MWVNTWFGAQHGASYMCLPAGPSGWQAPAQSATEQANGAAAQAQSPLKGKTVVIIGAGGAGRALVFGAAHAGAHVIIANRCRAVQCCAADLHRCAGLHCVVLLTEGSPLMGFSVEIKDECFDRARDGTVFV